MDDNYLEECIEIHKKLIGHYKKKVDSAKLALKITSLYMTVIILFPMILLPIANGFDLMPGPALTAALLMLLVLAFLPAMFFHDYFLSSCEHDYRRYKEERRRLDVFENRLSMGVITADDNVGALRTTPKGPRQKYVSAGWFERVLRSAVRMCEEREGKVMKIFTLIAYDVDNETPVLHTVVSDEAKGAVEKIGYTLEAANHVVLGVLPGCWQYTEQPNGGESYALEVCQIDA